MKIKELSNVIKIIQICIVIFIFLSIMKLQNKDSIADGPVSEEWTKTYENIDHGCGHSIQQTSDNGFIITGQIDDYFAIIKTDNIGNEQWRRIFGSDFQSGHGVGFSIIETKDGGYVATGEMYDNNFYSTYLWLIKIDSFGNDVWAKKYGGTWHDEGYSVKQTADGGYIIGGNTQSYGNGENGRPDIWLIKTDSYGNEEWNKTFGGKDSGSCYEIEITLDNGYIMVSTIRSSINVIKTDSVGNELWNKTFGEDVNAVARSIEKTNDGGYAIVGYIDSPIDYDSDIWLIKINDVGIEEWNKTIGGNGEDGGYSVFNAPDGGFIILGSTNSYGNGNIDAWLIKIDNSGNELWNKTFGGIKKDIGRSLVICSDNSYAIVGESDFEVWLIKINITEDHIRSDEDENGSFFIISIFLIIIIILIATFVIVKHFK